MKKLLPLMLAFAATSLSAQDFTAVPAEGSTINGSDLNTITLTWPEGTELSIDEWAYMEIKTLESYEASEEEDIFWSYVGYGFPDSWTLEGTTVTVHPDYYEIEEDGTYVVVIENGSIYVNGQTDRIVLKYDVIADGAPKIDLAVQGNTVDGQIVLEVPEGYTLSSVADDAQIVITDGEDYICNAEVSTCEGQLICLAPTTELEEGTYFVSIMDGTFLFNDDTVANAYVYSRFSVSHAVAIDQIAAEKTHTAYNLMGQRTHHIGRGLHVVDGKVVIR